MYKKESNGLIKHIDFVLLDMLCLQLAYILAYTIFIGDTNPNPYNTIYGSMAVLIAMASLVVMALGNTLKNVLKRGYFIEFVSTLQHVLVTFAVSILVLYLMKNAAQYSRLLFGFTFVFYFILTYLVRVFWKRYLRSKRSASGDVSLLVLTNEAYAPRVLKDLKEYNIAGYKISGLVILDKDMIGKKIKGIPVVANAENAAQYVCQEWVDEVMVIPEEDFIYPKQVVDDLMKTGVVVHITLGKIKNQPGRKQFVESISNHTVLTVAMNYATPWELFLKRLLDIIGGLVGCIITGILFIFVAPAIYKESPGPIFFSQERVGKNGKTFKMYKFRSMYMDAEERKAELMAQNKLGDARMFKLDFDPRVIGNEIRSDGTKKTGIGQFIRDTSIDEFPQFFSVLLGTMSLVGTRPPLPGEVSLYELHHRTRLAIKPGITGMWQVSGRSEITDFEEVVALDRQYIDQWSLGLDLKILLKTVLVVLKKEGAE